MLSKSFPVYILVLSGVGQVTFASPIARAGEGSSLYKRGLVTTHGPTNGLTVFNIAQIASSGCKQPEKPTEPAPEPEQPERLTLLDRILKVPGDLWNGLTQIKKVGSQENIDAFKKSAGDLGRAFSEIPAAMKSGINDLTNTENIDAFKRSFGDLKKSRP